MDNISWKHHYLPVFYLKGFTKESGKFKIYNVQKKQFVQKGKDFHPESHFYEKKSNTIFIPNGESDLIEKFYSDIETTAAKLINKINNADSSTRFDVSEEDMPMLNTFMSLIYWRLPANRLELQKIINNKSANELGFSIYNTEDNSLNHLATEEFKKKEDFIKIYKILTSLYDSIRGLDCRTPYTIIPKHEEFPFLCSDNPIIFEKEEFPDVHKDDYILPLSGKRFFIKADIVCKDPYLCILFDIVIYKQAIKYVSCTDKDYLRVLDILFEKYDMSLSQLKQLIFKKIKQKNI